MRPDRRAPLLVFLALALPFGLIFAFLTPPFQVPDETAHFVRAYCLSEGQLWLRRGAEGRIGCDVPISVPDLINLYGVLRERTGRTTSLREIFASFSAGTAPEGRQFVAYPVPASIPVAHFSQAIGIAAARFIGAGPLASFFSGRLTNFMITTAVAALAIHLLPFFRWTLALVALTPMTVFLRSSLSPDAVVISAAFLTFALALRISFADATRHRSWIFLALAAAVLVAVKPYFVVAMIVLLPVRRLRNRRFYANAAVVVALVILVQTTAAAQARRLYSPPAWAANIRPSEQEESIRRDPLRFARVAAEDYLHNGPRYAEHFVGRLGWLDVPLPRPVIITFLLLLGVVSLTEGTGGRQISVGQRIWFVLLVGTALGVISASQYVMWTPSGADFIEGIQGRYFIPVAPLALLVLANCRFALPERVVALTAMFSASAALVAGVIASARVW